MSMMERLLPFLPASKDIGGLLTPDGFTKKGVFFRSGTLRISKKEDLDSLLSIGIKNVVDLRSERAKKREPDPTKEDPRFHYRSFFISAGESLPLNKEDNKRLYLSMFHAKEELLPILLEIKKLGKGTLIHCSAGKDRTGTIVTLLLLIAGVSLEDINKEYLFPFDDLSDHLLSLKERNFNVVPTYYTKDPSFMMDILNSLKAEYGSFLNYFHELGLLDEDIKELKEMQL